VFLGVKTLFYSHCFVTLFLRVPLGQRGSFTGVDGITGLDGVGTGLNGFVPGSQFPVTLFLRVPLPHRVISLTASCISGS
jgi:hypothetical protein